MSQVALADDRAARTCRDWRDGRLDSPRARAVLLLLSLAPSLVGPCASREASDRSPAARGRMHAAMVELLQLKVLDDSPSAPLDLDAVADGRLLLSDWVRRLLSDAGPFLRRRLSEDTGPGRALARVTSIR